jgi:hypothetical protein
MEGSALERAYGTGRRRKASKGKTHERDQDEISLAGHEGSKASRGCETLRTQRNRIDVDVCRGKWLLVTGKTLKGKKPRKERDGHRRPGCGLVLWRSRGSALVTLCRGAKAC